MINIIFMFLKMDIPQSGKILVKNYVLQKRIAQTHMSDIWEVTKSNQNYIAKLISLDFYPDIKEQINKKGVNIVEIDKSVKKYNQDYIKLSRIPDFKHKPTIYEIGYANQFQCIYLIMDKFDGNMLNYPGNPKQFLIDCFSLLKDFHLNLSTSNNISIQDVMFKKRNVGNQTVFDLFLVDFKNSTPFGEVIDQDLTNQGNTCFSLNVLLGFPPTIFDDLESMMYIYAFISKIPIPQFSNHNMRMQIEQKTHLQFLPDVLRNAIFFLREFSKYVGNKKLEKADVIYFYEKTDLVKLIQGILDTNLVVNATIVQEDPNKIPQSELVFLYKIKEKVSQWGVIIEHDDKETFSKKVVEFIFRGQIYDPSTMMLIMEFLQIV